MSVRHILVLFSLIVLARAGNAIPEIQHWQTDKGAGVYFVETHEVPMLDVQVIFNAGSSRDGDLKGLSRLTASMMFEGAGGLDVDEISRHFDNLGAKYWSNSNNDTSALNLRVMSKQSILAQAIDCLETVLVNPDFAADAMDRQRARIITGIRQKLQSPGELANDAFIAAIYGDHPYASPEEGTEETLNHISVADLKRFHETYYVAANATIVLVGDVTRKQAEDLVQDLISGLPRGEMAAPLPEVKPLAAGKTIHIEHPSAQTHVLVGQPGIRRDDPDLFPLYVGNHILGGSGMVSRLFNEVREKRGLSYGTYSYFLPRLQAGPFVAGLQTRTDQADKALEVLLAQLQDFIEKGPAESELEVAKKNLTGGFPLRIDSNNDIASYVAMIGFHKLPLDYLETYNDRINAVTVGQIKAAFARILSPDTFVRVTVGPGQQQPET